MPCSLRLLFKTEQISISHYAKKLTNAGLGCPVGSVLVGPKDVIARARHYRKLMGGGWRQAGILAGACMYALEHHLPHLNLDHEAAQRLGNRLRMKGYSVEKVETNMVWVTLKTSCEELATILEKSGIRIFGGKGNKCRFVVHHQNRELIDSVLDAM